MLYAVLLSNFGLLIIDHIHFQYNGILFGILLLSIAYMCEEKFLKSAFCFAVLLNMKHIFVYVSPVYIVYLLKVYCWQNTSWMATVLNLAKLGAVTIGVTAASFGPFIHQIPQVRITIALGHSHFQNVLFFNYKMFFLSHLKCFRCFH